MPTLDPTRDAAGETRIPSHLRGKFLNDASLRRFTLDLTDGAASERARDDRSIESPRVADDRIGLRDSFGYAVSTSGRAIVRHDLDTDGSVTQDSGGSRIPGEPVVVPRPGARHEDDGCLSTYVSDEPTNSSEFVVLGGGDIAGDPVARVPLPQRVPFGFRGSWIPAAE